MAPAAHVRETALAGGLASACWAVHVREDVADWLVLPDGAVGQRADELRDLALPVRELPAPWRDGALRAQEALDRGGAGGAAALLVRAVGGAAPARAPDVLAARAAALLAADPALEADEVARRLAVSPRHLRRRFAEQVGFGPKRYARIMLQRLLALRARHPDAPAGRLAADAGYADHPHLARDCRELAGRTPSALLAQRAEIALHPS